MQMRGMDECVDRRMDGVDEKGAQTKPGKLRGDCVAAGMETF